MMERKRAFGYARVSLPRENIENQIHAIREFCERNEIDLVKVFTDVGVSGSKPAKKREGFSEMLRACELTGIKTIVIYDLTRLGRDLFDLIETYKELLNKKYNVLFVKHPELNTQPGSPIAESLRRALLTILGIVADLERAFISERTRAGMLRAIKEGKHVGRRPVEIPKDLVMKYWRMGLTKRAIYEILRDQGYLTYVEKGEKRVLSYDRFVKRLKQMGLGRRK